MPAYNVQSLKQRVFQVKFLNLKEKAGEIAN